MCSKFLKKMKFRCKFLIILSSIVCFFYVYSYGLFSSLAYELGFKDAEYIVIRDFPNPNMALNWCNCTQGCARPPIAITGWNLGGKYMGLGNQMFKLASVYGIGRSLGLDYLVIDQNMHFNFLKHFQTYDDAKRSFQVHKQAIWRIAKCCIYENLRANLTIDSCLDSDLLNIGEYLQSWKYFHRWRREILDLFQFNPDIVRDADTEFKNQPGSGLRIGCIHARRGDLMNKGSIKRGYTPTDSVHIHSAFRHLNQTMTSSEGAFRIFLFTDDPKWAAREFSQYPSGRISVIGRQKNTVAMRMMAAYCNSFVLATSTSTFSWWAVYLNKLNPTVYYNNRVAAPGSEIENEINVQDYFLPHWIPVDLG